MNYNEIKIGEYYSFRYYGSSLDYKNDTPTLYQMIFVVGRDPFSGKLVATCDEWLNKVDLLDYDDAELMEKI